MVNLASGERAPGEPFAWLLLDDLGIPFDCPAGGLDDPVRTVAGDTHGFDVVHEAREVLEVAPEPIHLLPGSLDGDAFADLQHLVPPPAAYRVYTAIESTVSSPRAVPGPMDQNVHLIPSWFRSRCSARRPAGTRW